MAEESILLKVGIDENQIARSEAAIVDSRKAIDSLKVAQKELANQGKKNTVEYVKGETAIKNLSTSVRENQRVLNANAKVQSASTGSISELRGSVSRLKQEYVDLSEAERSNIEVGGKLQKELLGQTDALKELEGEIGVTGRNVGNYSASIVEAADSTGLFSKAQKALALVQGVANKATDGGTIATRSFGKALILTGIGAIVVVLGSLVSYLTKTQEGMDFVARATEAVSAFTAVLFDELSRLGKQIIENVVPVFEGLGEIMLGLLTLDIDKLASGFDKVAKAVGNIDGINILEVGKNAAKAAKEAAALEGRMQDIVRAEKDLSLERAQSRQQIESLKKASDDVTLSTEARAAAAEKALTMELGLEQKAIELQEERIEVIKAKNALSTSTDADRNKAIDAEIELANLQQESVTKQIELNNKLNSINKVAADKNAASAKAETDRQSKAEAEALKTSKALQEKINADYSEAVEARAQETSAGIKSSLDGLKQQFADGIIDLDTYQEQLDQVEALAIETRTAALQGQLEQTQANAEIDAETRIELEASLQERLQALRDETLSAGVESQKAELNAAKALAADKVAVAKQVADGEMAAQDAVLNAAKAVFGEQSAAGKIAASFQALIDTYRGANLALGTIPPPFGQIIAAATVAQGLSNVAKINSKPPPKFEEGGGIEVNGPSHGGGGVDVALGGQTVANVEGGEGLFVMKRSAFGALKALSSFNQKHGGKSWSGAGQRHLADGGAVARAGVPSLDRRALSDTQQSFENAISSLTIVTKVSDLNRVQRESKMVEVQGDLR